MMIADLAKAERLTDDAAQLYDSLIYGTCSADEYERLAKEYADVDVFRMLRDVYALRRYRYGSRGWLRQRDRVFRKSDRFRGLCEGQVG